MIDGGFVHWEWPEDCLGYKLPIVIQAVNELGMYETIVDGCMVAQKGPEGGFIARSWKIMTTSKTMAKRMNLRCQRNRKCKTCKGSQTAAASTDYPKDMADRVVSAMLEETTCHDTMHQMPSGEVWLRRGDSLMVASVTQPRLATRKEVMEHHLYPRELPWTIVDGESKLLHGKDEDLEITTHDVDDEYNERTPPQQEWPSSRETPEGSAFWAQEDAAVEVELDLPCRGRS